MPRTIQADGKTYTVPDDATPEEVNQIVGAAPQKGFLSSLASSSGVTGIPQMIAHPSSIIDGIKQTVQNSRDSFNQGVADFKQGGLSEATRRDFGRAVPIVGPALAQAQAQHDAGNNAGMAGTLAGTVAAFAAPEAGGRALGLVRKAAPAVAEGALGISKLDRINGAVPGRGVLDETTGVNPDSIYVQSKAVIHDLKTKVNNLAANHQGPVSIANAQDVVQNAIDSAKRSNSALSVDALSPLQDQVTKNMFGRPQPFQAESVAPAGSEASQIAKAWLPKNLASKVDTAQPGPTPDMLAPMQTATDALNLKRGIRSQFVKNWNPDLSPAITRDTAKAASGAVNNSLNDALGPEFSQANQRMSSLIPVQDAAESISRNAPILQKIIGRTRAHTGSLTTALAGAAAGHATGGTMGGLIGGAAGLAIPEMIGGPTATMIMARGMDSTLPSLIARPALAAPLLIPRKKIGDDQ